MRSKRSDLFSKKSLNGYAKRLASGSGGIGNGILSIFEGDSRLPIKAAAIAALSMLFLLFEGLVPVIALAAAAVVYALRSRKDAAQGSYPREFRSTPTAVSRPKETVASRILDAVSIQPVNDEGREKLSLADVIPLNNSFAPAWKDLDDFLQATLDVIKTRFEFQTANVFLFDPESDTLIQSAYVTRTSSIARLAAIKVGHGLVGWVAKNLRPLVVSNLRHEGRSLGYYFAGGERISSFAAAPITVDGQLAGVIALDHSQPGMFSSPETEEALTAMASLLARVLGAEESLEITRREVDRIRETQKILSAAYDATNLDVVAESVLKKVVQLTDFHSLSCYLLDESGAPSRRAEIGFHGIESFHCKDLVATRAVQQAIQQCSPFRLEGVALAAQYRIGKSVGERIPEVLAAYPILYRGVALGAIAVEVMEAKVLDDRIDGILSDVVSGLGAGLMRIYRSSTAEGSAKEESDLMKFSAGLLTLENAGEIWERIFDNLVEKNGCSGILYYRAGEEEFRLESSRGCEDPLLQVSRHSGLIGWTALAGRPVVSARGDRRQAPVKAGESFLAYPVSSDKSDGEPEKAGVLLLVSEEEGAFGVDTIARLDEFMEFVIPILRNAERMEKVSEIADIDKPTGLFNYEGFERRVPCLSYSGDVGLVLMRVDNTEELFATYGHGEVKRFFTGLGRLLRMKVINADIVRGGSVIAARLEGARFGFAANGDPEKLKAELHKIITSSKGTSLAQTPVSYSISTAWSNDGIPVAELLDAAEGRFLSGRKETRTVSAA